MPAEPPSDSQLDTMRVIRRLTRQLGDGTASDLDAVADPLLGRYHFRLKLDGSLVPTIDGWERFLAERLRELVLLKSDPRGLRLCEAETCRWLFLDDTRNQRRRWCDMATCGSRAKMRSYRARRSGSPSPSPMAAAHASTQAPPARKETPA